MNYCETCEDRDLTKLELYEENDRFTVYQCPDCYEFISVSNITGSIVEGYMN